MFHLPDSVGLGVGHGTKVFTKVNGTSGPLKEVYLLANTQIDEFIEKAGRALDLDAPVKAFFSSGVECVDADHLTEDDVIYISRGEAFKASEAGDSREVVGGYMLRGNLGQGGFGTVMRGVHMETGEIAALKFVPKATFKELSDLQRVFQEIQALRNLRHPNIVRILDVADHPNSVCFIMEYCEGGELRGYVEKNTFLAEEESRSFFKQIVRPVHYCHTKNIIHRDLKLENILLDNEMRCKIVDFGLSDYVSSKERTVTDAGTQAYLAPEVYSGRSGDSDPFKIDVWALGVILYAMSHGRLPFGCPDTEACSMLDSAGLKFKEELSAGLKRLVQMMLTPRPEKRASMNDISIDSWVTKHRFARFGDETASLGEDSSDDADAANPFAVGGAAQRAKERAALADGKDTDTSPEGGASLPLAGEVTISAVFS